MPQGDHTHLSYCTIGWLQWRAGRPSRDEKQFAWNCPLRIKIAAGIMVADFLHCHDKGSAYIRNDANRTDC
jgi:hypothetical protein